MRTSNPMLGENTFKPVGQSGATMTINGTVNRTFLLVALVFAGAYFTWTKFRGPEPAAAMPWAWGGLIGGLVLALVTCFVKRAAPFTAPAYAVCEGLFLGAISALLEAKYKGIVFNALFLTVATLFCLLAAYRTGLIKPSENFKLGVFAATGAIALIYVVSMVMRMFGTQMPFIHESGWMGIGFSAFVTVVAAMNLVLDFDFIEQGESAGAPKYMEWYAAFGLLVTLVWLYIEFLRLLAKLRSR